MTRTRTILSLAVMVAALVAGWAVREPWQPAPVAAEETVSDATARELLRDRVAKLAVAPTREGFCSGDDDGWCRSHWLSAGGDRAAPWIPPHVLDSVVRDGIRVLVLCGRDGTGEVYGSDYPVTFRDGRPTPNLPIHWYGLLFSGRGSASEIAGEGHGAPPVPTGAPECHGWRRPPAGGRVG